MKSGHVLTANTVGLAFCALLFCQHATSSELTRQVSSGSDDGYSWGSTSQNTSTEYLNIGDHSTASPPYNRAAFRFTNISIPQGSTIVSAYLKVRSRSNFNADQIYLNINADDVDNSNSFSSTPYIGQRTLTSATEYWDFDSSWSTNSQYTSPNLDNVVEEVISRSGWSSGNALSIFISDGLDGYDTRSIWSYDGSSSYAPELTIEFTEAATPNITPYQPSGWDDKIVVSDVTGTRTDAAAFYVNQTLYIDRAWINNGNADAGSFRKKLYIGNVEVGYSDGSLSAGSSSAVSDFAYTFTTTGIHTLKLVVDSEDDISESNENDNEYERQIIILPEPTAPNITPYQPTGWDDKIVVSDVTGTTTDASAFYVNQTLYIDRAWANLGDADASSFRKILYINNVAVSISDGSLNSGSWAGVSDFAYTFTTTGTHTLKLVVDTDDDISESIENDNEYERQITILPEQTAPNITPYQPSGWDDKIVVSDVTDTRTDAAAFYVNQTLYIDRAWINNGNADAGSFRKKLYIDNVEVGYSDGSLSAGSSSAVSDFAYTFTTTGIHTLKLVVDSEDDISESNENDNEYERQINLMLSDNDPLYNNQWHLNNTGQDGGTAGEDANVESVWNQYKGTHDQIIAIIDDGLEIDHEDLSPNVIAGLSVDYNFILPDDGNPSPSNNDDNHGTAVSGVAAAHGWNGLGVRGVAPEAGLVGYKIFEGGIFYDGDVADAWSRNMEVVSVYNSSWGTENDIDVLRDYSVEQMDALEDAVTNGRGGLGSIHIKAAGNGGQNSNGNYNGFGNSRYVISVGASDADGGRSSYTTPGANVRVNAPSSEISHLITPAITTTDRTGTEGYNNTNYTTNGADGFGGTSSAAPLVSGVVALILQANPDLTWRDVQMILMETADKNDPTDNGWAVNGANHDIHYDNGFGRVDAQAAVTAAETWTLLPDEDWVVSGVYEPDTSIPDNDNTGVSDSIEISYPLNIEFVEIIFSASDHDNWGDLEITLTSPAGTESILAEEHNSSGTNDNFDNWRFGSARHLDESSQGVWTLTVRDLEAGNSGTFEDWQLRIFGTLIEVANTPTAISPSDDAVINSLTPSFQWSAYSHPDVFQTQSGYQFRVRSDTDGDTVVYDTGFVPSTSGNSHTYSPGTYTGFDSVSGIVRISDPLEWNKNYHWHARFRDSDGDWSKWSADMVGNHQNFSTADTTSPSVTITSPTTGSTHSASTSPINIGGSASDNIGVTQVTWVNDRGGSGTASGTTSWSVSNIPLQSGVNGITVTARDAADNTTTDTLTVTYTPPLPAPTVTTNAATSPGQTGATLNASVDPNGSSTTVYFDYGLNSSYGSSTTYGNIGPGTSSVSTPKIISGLTCNTTYHFRARASNSGGTTNGSDRSFTTNPCPQPAPTVTTNAATSPGQTGATLNASVDPNGSSTTVYFDYGLNSSYGSSTTYGNIGPGTSSVSTPKVISGLTCNTTYHFRARASNSGGTTEGGDESFTTNACSSANTWLTFQGEVGIDEGYATAKDSSGNFYLIGSSATTWGSPINAHSGGDSDVLIVKLDSNGNYVWHTYLGSSSIDYGKAGVVDSSGNLFFAGDSEADWGGSPKNSHNGGKDLVVGKVSSSGALLWHSFEGTSQGDGGSDIALDSSENPLVLGRGNHNKILLTKYLSDGTYQWETIYGSTTYPHQLVLDSSNNIYVTGNNQNLTTLGTNNGGYDAFIAKFNSSGTFLSGKQFGGSVNDVGFSLDMDTSGNFYISGYSASTWGSPVNAFNSGEEIFVAKLDSSFNILWNTFLGSSSNDRAYDAFLDSANNLFVTGYSGGTWPTAGENAHSGGSDIFLAKINSSGVKQWHKFFGAANDDLGYGVIPVDANYLLLTGSSYSTWGLPINPHSSSASANDAVVTKLVKEDNLPTTFTCLSEDGEGLSNGASVPGWDQYQFDPNSQTKTSVTATTIAANIHSGGGALNVNGDHYLGKEFNYVCGGVVTADYWHFPKPGNVTNSAFALFGTGGEQFLTIQKNDEDKWWVNGIYVAEYSQQYSHIVVTIDTSTGLFDVEIDGQTVAYQVSVGNGGTIGNGIRYATLHSGEGGTGTDSYVDDLVISGQIPKSILDDSFEYLDSPSNHGWDVTGDDDEVFTSDSVSTDGDRSARLRHVSNVNSYMFYELGEKPLICPTTVSIQYYDEMISGPNYDTTAYMYFDGDAKHASIGFYNGSNYVYNYAGDSGSAANADSGVARSAGWHEFRWQIDASGQVSMYIDDQLIILNPITVETISQMRLSIGQEQPLSAYFDEAKITQQCNFDFDNDGTADIFDADIDNDGIINATDFDPFNYNICADSDSDSCDDCVIGIDGFGPFSDNTPLNDGLDTDSDGLCNIGDGDDDNDGMDDDFENNNGLDPLNPADAGSDPDNDGLTNLEEFNKDPNLDPNDPDSDGDGIHDGIDAYPTVASNLCTEENETLENQSISIPVTCAAEGSINVMGTVGVNISGNLELISPITTFYPGFSVDGEMQVHSMSPGIDRFTIDGFSIDCNNPVNTTYYYIDDSSGMPILKIGNHTDEFLIESGKVDSATEMLIRVNGNFGNWVEHSQLCSGGPYPNGNNVSPGLHIAATSGKKWSAYFTISNDASSLTVTTITIVPLVE